MDASEDTLVIAQQPAQTPRVASETNGVGLRDTRDLFVRPCRLLALRFIRRSAASYLLLRQKRSRCHRRETHDCMHGCPDRPGPGTAARLIGAPSPALARSWGGLCCVGHPGFVAFAAVAPTIPVTVPTFSAVTSRPFGGSTSGGRGGTGAAGLSVMPNISI
jgi:hypothetical protein